MSSDEFSGFVNFGDTFVVPDFAFDGVNSSLGYGYYTPNIVRMTGSLPRNSALSATIMIFS